MDSFSSRQIGEAMFSVFSLTTSMLNLAYNRFYDLHCEMALPCVLDT